MRRDVLARVTCSLGAVLLGVSTPVAEAVCQTETSHSLRNASTTTAVPRLAAGKVASVGSEEAIAIAQRWIDALKSKDAARVAEQTLIPFRFVTTNREKICEGLASDAAKLDLMVNCLAHRDKLFVGELENAPTLKMKAIGKAQVPPALRKLGGKLEEGDRLVTSFINGDGVTFEFVVVVGASAGHGRVRALLLSAEFESGQ